MSVSNPVTLDEMREYVFTRLGYPVVNVELAPSQVDVIISDTVQEYQKYAYGEGVNLVNTTLLVSAGVSDYYTGDSNIQAVFDIGLSFAMGDINTLFSPTHMLLYDDWVTKGNYPGGAGGGGFNFGTGALTNYEIMGEYMAQADQMFGEQYTINYISSEQKLVITPTPKSCMIAKIGLYRSGDATKLYNNNIVKRLAVAKAKIQWGLNIGKYSITLPDGTTMNGFQIMDKGYEEEEKWWEQLILESEPCDFMVG